MERVAVVDKDIYVALLESLRPEERMYSHPSLRALRDSIASGVRARDESSLCLIASCPEGFRYIYFQIKL